MAGPNPFIFFIFYQIYLKRFYKNPQNTGKEPKGCFSWCIAFYFKLLLFSVAFLLILALVMWVFSLFE